MRMQTSISKRFALDGAAIVVSDIDEAGGMTRFV